MVSEFGLSGDSGELSDLDGVVVDSDGRVRARMARNAKGGAVNE